MANYETCSRSPDANFLQKILSVCPNTSAEWLLTGEGSKIKGEGPGFDREMFFEVLEAVDELQLGDTLRVKAEAAFGYYDFFSDGEYKATKKDVMSLAAFSADLSGKIQEFGGFEKVKESGIGNLIKIIGSVSKKTR